MGKLDHKCEDLQTNFSNLSETVRDQSIRFEDLATTYRNECLWRVKDAEELLKSRVPYVQLETAVKALKSSMEFDVKNLKELHSSQLTSETQKLQDS